MKILVFTDSRGVHRPIGSTHEIYASRLAKTPGLDVTSFLCPYQWTTIPDFLHAIETYENLDTTKYDRVILHAGIVDHSPRPLNQMLHKLHDPQHVTPDQAVAELFATRKFTNNKIINKKKPLIERLFTEKSVAEYFSKPFNEEYEHEKTINLYSKEVLRESIIPRLKKIENLIFIGSNDFCDGWNGDFEKQRPSNIRMIEEYSRILCRELPAAINLHQWSQADVKKFTCDNLHLSAEGNNWIFVRILEELGMRPRDYLKSRKTVGTPARKTYWPMRTVEPETSLGSIQMDEPLELSPDEIAHLRSEHGKGNSIATLIIGVRFKDDDTSRLDNLRFLLSWIERFYGTLFDVLIIEQDIKPTRNFRELVPGDYRYEFLYNPEAYNRGWLYNVAVKDYTSAQVVAFCDTDILPGGNFLDCIIDCFKDFDAISPNRNLYYSSEVEKLAVISGGSYAHIPVTEPALKNPTTMAGGMLIVNRTKFIEIGGFEQYVGYGCEDRALDVAMLALLDPSRIRMDSKAYFHLHHPVHKSERAYFNDIYAHMVENYGCEYTPGLTTTSYIHANCCHAEAAQIRSLTEARAQATGDAAMYHNHSYLTVNGLPPTFNGKLIPISRPEPVFPPTFTTLNEYIEKEEFLGRYAASWAPPVPKDQAGADSDELAFFYNKFRGKRCFIIGNGPSLNKIDLSLLKNEYSFAVNSFYYKTHETGFRPTFFVVEDSSVIKENKDEIVGYEAPFKFFPSIYKSLHPKKPGTYFFKINRGFYEKSSPNYCVPRFSTDITKGAYCGQSVTYINLQLAFYMGFTEVFLIGMDFSYQIPESHQRTGDVLLSDTDDPNHFHKDYFGKGKTWKDPKLDRVLMNYKMASLVYECAGRKIFNATVGGNLEVFDRVDFNGLFNGRDIRFQQAPLDLSRPSADLKNEATPIKPPAQTPPRPASTALTQAPSKSSQEIGSTVSNTVMDSIAVANKLYSAGKYAECIVMCDRLHSARGLRMYKQLADKAKLSQAASR